jgi:hypothetical protein
MKKKTWLTLIGLSIVLFFFSFTIGQFKPPIQKPGISATEIDAPALSGHVRKVGICNGRILQPNYP